MSGLLSVLIAAALGLLWLSVPALWIWAVYVPGGPRVSPWLLFAALSLFSVVCARLALGFLDRGGRS